MKLQFKNKILDLDKRTGIMGILNLTPDSFSDGGKYFNNPDLINNTVEQMARDGVDIVDIGGESSRPGSRPVSAEEEINRIKDSVINIRQRFPDILISIDTYKSKVAKEMIGIGIDIINDISALRKDDGLTGIVSESGCYLILMHMSGLSPADMQKKTNYKDCVNDIKFFFRERINYCLSNKIPAEKIMIDPGIGFGKTYEHNIEILNRLDEFKEFGLPIVIGASRKSFLNNIVNRPPEKRDWATAAAVAYSIIKGANIVRIHNTFDCADVVKTTDAIVYKTTNYN